MRSSLIALLISFGTAFIATIIVRYLCKKYKIVDQPDGFRKVHTRSTPLCGGFAVFAGFILPVILINVFLPDTYIAQNVLSKQLPMITFFSGAVITMLMGAVDDIWQLRPRWKVLFQLIAATFAYCGGLKISSITMPFLGGVDLGHLSYPVTVFWFLGCINVINLLDGLDGLASGVGLFASITLFIVSSVFNNHLPMFLSACLIGAILAFLLFNFNPASIFLGDTGSMLIGYLIAGIGLLSSYKSSAAVSLIIPFIALGLPIFDTILAILRRWSKNLPISAADKKHVHHILLSLGLSHRNTVLVLYIFCLLFGGVSVLIATQQNLVAGVILLLLAIVAFIAVQISGMLDISLIKNKLQTDRRERKKESHASVEVEKSTQVMSTQNSIKELWDCCLQSFETLDLDHTTLIIESAEINIQLEWKSCNLHEKGHDQWSLFLNLHEQENIIGKFHVWKKGEEMPIRNTSYLINKLRHALTSHTIRVLQHNAKANTPASELIAAQVHKNNHKSAPQEVN
ncbi:MAG: undecaprenyl/decaprenyl-phosphate alpha-N-acetylglucosaminyl 1-phosphate transferase [Lentisphaeraceae bacterium]|nr:undecaprenyl/decaprenyl-phosphate alpha-N-acetylglucosaminyl 1-phosphate transferase [Lentisphaeraceae bacterium]